MKSKPNPGILYTFGSSIWQHSSQGGWYFVTVPFEISSEIRENLKWQEEGWGRMRAIAKIGATEWQTAIWYDRKINSYLLPVKEDVRLAENLKAGDLIVVKISV